MEFWKEKERRDRMFPARARRQTGAADAAVDAGRHSRGSEVGREAQVQEPRAAASGSLWQRIGYSRVEFSIPSNECGVLM